MGTTARCDWRHRVTYSHRHLLLENLGTLACAKVLQIRQEEGYSTRALRQLVGEMGRSVGVADVDRKEESTSLVNPVAQEDRGE